MTPLLFATETSADPSAYCYPFDGSETEPHGAYLRSVSKWFDGPGWSYKAWDQVRARQRHLNKQRQWVCCTIQQLRVQSNDLNRLVHPVSMLQLQLPSACTAAVAEVQSKSGFPATRCKTASGLLSITRHHLRHAGTRTVMLYFDGLEPLMLSIVIASYLRCIGRQSFKAWSMRTLLSRKQWLTSTDNKSLWTCSQDEQGPASNCVCQEGQNDVGSFA